MVSTTTHSSGSYFVGAHPFCSQLCSASCLYKSFWVSPSLLFNLLPSSFSLSSLSSSSQSLYSTSQSLCFSHMCVCSVSTLTRTEISISPLSSMWLPCNQARSSGFHYRTAQCPATVLEPALTQDPLLFIPANIQDLTLPQAALTLPVQQELTPLSRGQLRYGPKGEFLGVAEHRDHGICLVLRWVSTVGQITAQSLCSIKTR